MNKPHEIALSCISDTLQGYEYLGCLSARLSSLYHQQVDILFNMSGCKWVAANLLSAVGALCMDYKKNSPQSNITFKDIPSNIETLWSRNNFNSIFGKRGVPSTTSSTTIDFKCFDRNSYKDFMQHFKEHVLSRLQNPQKKNTLNLSPDLIQHLATEASEIYLNFLDHTEAENCITCGQYFPTKKCLSFTIVDTGDTIPYKVSTHLNKKSLRWESSYIEWALVQGNSTKADGRPNGLGLTLMHDLLGKNKGSIRILSGEEFYQNSKGRVVTKILPYKFQGTVVTLTFNLKDTTSYFLSSENTDNLF